MVDQGAKEGENKSTVPKESLSEAKEKCMVPLVDGIGRSGKGSNNR